MSNSEKHRKGDSRKGPSTLFFVDGKVVRRHPKHRPWNAAPKQRSWANRESYGKKFGEFLDNYDTVSRERVKKMVEKDIDEQIAEAEEEGMNVYPVTCLWCGKTYDIKAKPSMAKKYQNGELLVHEAFPHLSVDERELLISGMCGKCFDRELKPLDEE